MPIQSGHPSIHHRRQGTYKVLRFEPYRIASSWLLQRLIDKIHTAYRLLYSKGIMSEGIQEIKNNLEVTKEIQYIIDFVELSKRGIIR